MPSFLRRAAGDIGRHQAPRRMVIISSNNRAFYPPVDPNDVSSRCLLLRFSTAVAAMGSTRQESSQSPHVLAMGVFRDVGKSRLSQLILVRCREQTGHTGHT